MPQVETTFDDLTDSMSVYFVGSRARSMLPAKADGHILLESDTDGCVVGLQLLGTVSLDQAKWPHHPDRSSIPAELLSELDRWLMHRKLV